MPLKRLRLPRADVREHRRSEAGADAGSPPVAGSTTAPAAGVPEATVGRLPTYLQALHGLADAGVTTVSSQELAETVHVSAAMLRKDLSHLGSYGTRGVGYDVATLVHEMSGVLGLEHDWPVAIVGVGNLGRALAHYGGFSSRGLSIAALFDADPAVVGTVVNGRTVHHVDTAAALVRERGVRIAVVATPAAAAQSACDLLVAAGVTSILCFAGGTVRVPAGVTVRAVDLSSELQILGFHEQRKRSDVLDDVPAVVRPAARLAGRGPDARGGAATAPTGTEAAR
ncbi:redox-sensing transcriptional repressor Rex [Aquipuribacter sp. SD81]|uniref:redox-sensing transcriptional repressor Rex n=1 Tax=Aquipuribacter sp. SD81 TaxID=3127703 RepID=UPI003015BF08